MDVPLQVSLALFSTPPLRSSKVDDVILIAGIRAGSETDPPAAAEETSSIESLRLARQTPPQDVLPEDVRALVRLQSPRALGPRKYLRHSSLRC